MSKPDWKDAPEWAQWLARDQDGRWFWYETRPIALDQRWITDGRSLFAGHGDGWLASREPRP